MGKSHVWIIEGMSLLFRYCMTVKCNLKKRKKGMPKALTLFGLPFVWIQFNCIRKKSLQKFFRGVVFKNL